MCFAWLVFLCLVAPVWEYDHFMGEDGAGCFDIQQTSMTRTTVIPTAQENK